jgi:pimeloyl-ACP methyl ester carboxylesterase
VKFRRLLWFLLGWRVFGPIIAPRWRSAQEHPWRVAGRTVFVGDAEFMVRQIGPDGAPDVVLIHGLGGSSLGEWYAPGRLLAERFRVTMVDQRSHGLSPKVSSRFEIDDVADDVAAVLGELDIHTADVVGYSMGGAIAQALAHRHPSRVRRLVLVATLAAHPPLSRAVRTAATWLLRAWERMTGLGTPEVRWAYLVGTGAVSTSYGRWLWAETHRRDIEAGAAATQAILRFDSRPWLEQLDHPVLAVIPTKDFLVPPVWQYAMASRLRHVEIAELAGARHEVPWAHADQLVSVVSEFLTRASA